jgi:hypothetical protein
VNVLAIYFANEYLMSLSEGSKACRNTYAVETGPGLRDRMASAVAALRGFLENPVESTGPVPALKDYPYRS